MKVVSLSINIQAFLAIMALDFDFFMYGKIKFVLDFFLLFEGLCINDVVYLPLSTSHGFFMLFFCFSIFVFLQVIVSII